MSANARLLVEIAASLGTFREDMGRAAAVAEANGKRIDKAIGDVKAGAISAGKAIAGALGVSLSVGAAVAAFHAIRDAAADEQRSLNQLEATLEATGHAAGLTADQLERIGKAIQDKTVFDDDEIRKAETALLRFRDVQGDVFEQAIKLAPDVATALGVDLPTAAQALGKALTDPEHGMKALKAAGLALSEQQKDLAARMIETGDKAGAQKIVLDELTGSIGGLSEADNKGAYGATKRLERAWGDLLKTMGRPLVQQNGWVDKVTEFLNRAERVISRPRKFSNEEGLGPLAEILGIKDEKFAFPTAPDPSEQGLDRAKEREAAIGKIRSDAAAADEAAYVKWHEGLKAREAAASTFYGAQLALQKGYLDRESIQTDFAYSRGALTVEEFYDAQKKAANDAADATDKYLEKQAFAALALEQSDRTTQAEKLALRAKVAGFEEQANQNQVQLGNKNIQIDNDRIKSLEKLGDEYGSLAERVQLALGNTAAASAISGERADRALRRQLEHIRDTGTPEQSADAERQLNEIADLAKRTTLQGALTDETRKYSNIVQDLGVETARVDLLAETGTLSEIDLLNKKADIAKAYIPLLLAQIEAQQKIANELPQGPAKDDALRKIAEEKLLIEQLGVTANAVKNKIDGIFTDNFTTALDAIVMRTKSVKGAFSDMARGITAELAHLANQQIAKTIGNALFGPSTGAGASGGGLLDGLLGSLFSGNNSGAGYGMNDRGTGTSSGGIGGLFGLLGKGLVSSLGGVPGESLSDSLLSQLLDSGALGALADGTDNWRGGPTWVGERGPELVNLPRGAQVIPNHVLQQRRAERMQGGTTILNQTTVNVLPGASRASADQAAQQMGRQLSRARRIS